MLALGKEQFPGSASISPAIACSHCYSVSAPVSSNSKGGALPIPAVSTMATALTQIGTPMTNMLLTLSQLHPTYQQGLAWKLHL